MNHMTHLLLVSKQPTPNLTATLDPLMAPNRVILIVSPDMRQRAGWLRAVFTARGVKVDDWSIDDPWDIDHVQKRMLLLLQREIANVSGQGVALNATGGTKPMSIAAYEACRGLNVPIFYVHPELDRVIWMHPNGRPPIDLADKLKLEPFLEAHGASVQPPLHRDHVSAADIDLATNILMQIERYQPSLPPFNALVGNAKETRRVDIRADQQRKKEFGELIEIFQVAGRLRRVSNRLQFETEDDRAFVNGGWFERYVFSQASLIRPKSTGLQDCACNVLVTRRRGSKSILNELDVALLSGNRLHVIECKTGIWDKAGSESRGAGTLYKLDSLADLLGGIEARAMLVSYQELPGADRRRAKELKIAVCAGQDVQELGQILTAWVE